MIALAAATALLMTAAAVWRQRPPRAAELCAGMLAGAVYFLVVADVGAAVLEPVAWLGPLAFNRAVHAGFGDRARPAWADAVLALISLACGAVWTRGFDVLALLLFAEAPLRVMTGAGDDLVAWRRLARRWFLGFGGLLACAVSLAVLLGAGSMAAQSAAVGAILLCLAAAGRPWPVELALAAHASPPAGLDAQEAQQLARLRRLMQEEQAFRDPRAARPAPGALHARPAARQAC